MTLKVLTYNKNRQTLDSFEKAARDFVSTAPTVVGLKAFESPATGELVFQFELGTERKASQDICILGWTDMQTIEGLVNATLEGIRDAGKQAKHINLVALSKTPRVLAAMIVEGVSSDQQHKTETEKPNPGTDEKSNPGTKRSQRRANRKPAEQQTNEGIN